MFDVVLQLERSRAVHLTNDNPILTLAALLFVEHHHWVGCMRGPVPKLCSTGLPDGLGMHKI